MTARWTTLKSLAIVAILPIACSDATGPAPSVANRSYSVIRLNAQTLPEEVDSYIDVEGRSCVDMLTSGNITFSSDGRFNLGLIAVRSCNNTFAGTSHDEVRGRYTQSGSTLTFQIEFTGFTALTTAKVSGNTISLVGTRRSGARLELTFEN